MIIDTECPDCNGNGEVVGSKPSSRSRFVGHDDLSPDDFTVDCPRCLGRGVVDYDPNEEAPDDSWDGPLTDAESAMIDAAWERHKAAAPTQ